MKVVKMCHEKFLKPNPFLWPFRKALSGVLILMTGASPAFALEGMSFYSAAMEGNCSVEIFFNGEATNKGARANIRIPSKIWFAGGNYFSFNSDSIGTDDPISESVLENTCGLGNVTDLVQDGADGTFETDDEISASFTANTPTGRYDFVIGLFGVTNTQVVDTATLVATFPTVTLSGLSGTVTGSQTVEITFSEGVTGFDVSDLVLSNLSVTDFTVVNPGTYRVTVAPLGEGPVSVAVPAGSAQAVNELPNTASSTLAAEALDTGQTLAENARFMLNRSNNLLSNQPDLAPFLMGRNAAGTFNADITRGGGSVAFATSPDHPVWVALRGAWSTSENTETDYVLGTFGGHFSPVNNVLLGVMAQFDLAEDRTGSTTIEGTGWLVGPYVVARHPSQPLIFDARLLYGETDNTVSVDGSATDHFDTTRLLVQARLSGEYEMPDLTFVPYVDLSHTWDRQERYRNEAGVAIPEQTTQLSKAVLGLNLRKPLSVRTGSATLTAGIAGDWTETTTEDHVPDITAGFEGGRGRFDLGFERMLSNGSMFSLGGFYDGVGTDSYEAYGLDLLLAVQF